MGEAITTKIQQSENRREKGVASVTLPCCLIKGVRLDKAWRVIGSEFALLLFVNLQWSIPMESS